MPQSHAQVWVRLGLMSGKRPGRWPYGSCFHPLPSPMGWARQSTGALPLDAPDQRAKGPAVYLAQPAGLIVPHRFRVKKKANQARMFPKRWTDRERVGVQPKEFVVQALLTCD